MLHGSPRPGLASSELIRLLAGLSDAPPSTARPVFTERLGAWLDWTGAISLSAALHGDPPEPAPGTAVDADADFHRVRLRLEAAIDAAPAEPASGDDFAPHRRHCLARQQAMQEAIGALRQRLRDALSRCSPALARLAAIDAVMDHTLAAHERSLLGLVPLRLQAHFERLHASGGHAADSFRHDMNRLLRAELAHRLLPAQGLLDALVEHREHA